MSHLEHLLSWLLTTKHKAARHLLRADDTPPPACTGSPPHVISNHWGISNSRMRRRTKEGENGCPLMRYGEAGKMVKQTTPQGK
ncbi:hypothetical protein L1887_28733 [Cichorium endivia]|nr:hypothetical protein L1887_28733 [Cichorium endivia]